MELERIVPETLAVSLTIMTGFMREPTKTFKTFDELLEIFARDHESVAGDGDASKDLRVFEFEPAMMGGEWRGSIVFPRDEDGRIADGIHRGIAYLRCLANGASPAVLPPLVLAPLGTWQWPSGLKERVMSEMDSIDYRPKRWAFTMPPASDR
jgi:hypothetical protein